MLFILLFNLSCAVALSGCNATSTAHSSGGVAHINSHAVTPFPQWQDAHFQLTNISVPEQESIFWLDDEAIQFAKRTSNNTQSINEQIRALSYGILNRTGLNLLYAADANTNANTTFLNRAANCLSLTIMTYALAEKAGFSAQFQQVHIPEYWTERDGQSFINSHVNVRIQPNALMRNQMLFPHMTVVDFDPIANRSAMKSDVITKQRIIAMFYNNQGADALLRYEHNQAYALFKAAIETDTQFPDVWVNLGLLYKREGLLSAAEESYRFAIALNDKKTAWENLAYLYRFTGKTEQAEEIFERLERQRLNNPYYHYMLAQRALNEGDVEESIIKFKRAISLDDHPHQFYAGLAEAYAQQNLFEKSRHYLRLAKRKAEFADEVQRYESKLSVLANVQAGH
ncbi:MAG: hypothetical protein P8J70_07655 [Glaciecola sp.]|nr:hypothetical protein [Glaciecola sp.]MDG1814534.1 hypothetical protein [Glaciecola sp.]MDG2099534.1 hypothetical protein [Glaciecola sp.]